MDQQANPHEVTRVVEAADAANVMDRQVDPHEVTEFVEAAEENAELLESAAEFSPPVEDLTTVQELMSSETQTPQQPESEEIDDKVKQPKPSAPPLEQAEAQTCNFCNTVHSFLCPPGEKQLCDLTLVDLLLWTNVPISAIAFVLGQVLYVLLEIYEFSIITLVSRSLFFSVVLAFIYVIARRAIKNQAQEPGEPTQPVVLTEEMFKPYVDSLISMLNGFLKYYLSVLFCENIRKTLQFAFLVHFVAFLSTVFSTTNLIYIVFCFAFSVPKFYTVYKKQIDANLAKLQSHANELIRLVKTKLPKNTNAAPAPSQKHKKKE